MRLPIVLCGIVLALSGCSGRPNVVPVAGTVTLDGKPLAHAVVAFNPAAMPGKIEAPGPGSMAVTDEQGRFELKIIGTDGKSIGAVVGEHRVRISTADLKSGDSDAAGAASREPKERVPAKYNRNSELKFTVPASGTSEANFTLHTN